MPNDKYDTGLYLLSPAMFLMNTCIVDSGSAEDEREERDEMDEMLLERMAATQTGDFAWVRRLRRRMTWWR